MLKTLGDEGYQIEWRVVNSADYGFPQRRIRVFIIAERQSKSKLDPYDVVFKSGVLAKALPVKPTISESSKIEIIGTADLISRGFNLGASKSPFLNSGVYLNGEAFSFRTSSSYKGSKSTLGDVVVSDEEVPSEYWVSRESLKDWKFLKGAKSIERVHKGSGTPYSYAEGKMAFPDLLSNPSRTILTGEGGNSPSRFKHIIQVDAGYRRLLPVELERLNGFPDGWTEFGPNGTRIPDSRRAFFMGNALVVGLISRVGKELAKRL
jgi:DNA (cytosine-5)-methyltransferase 1